MSDVSSPPDLSDFKAAFSAWISRYGESLIGRYEAYALRSCETLARTTGQAVLAWCEARELSASELNPKLWDAEQLIPELYDALGQQNDQPVRTRYSFWQHLDIAHLIADTTKTHRDGLVDRQSLKRCADSYLSKSWLHNSYLDWVFVDALIAAELIATYDWLMGRRFGLAYALADGRRLKTFAFRCLIAPTTFFLGWILPGTAALIAAASYYGLSFGLLAVQLGYRVLRRLRGGKSRRQVMTDMILSMTNTYLQLRETTVHVPSLKHAVKDATGKGISWDPQLLCILDNVAQKHAIVWTSR